MNDADKTWLSDGFAEVTFLPIPSRHVQKDILPTAHSEVVMYTSHNLQHHIYRRFKKHFPYILRMLATVR